MSREIGSSFRLKSREGAGSIPSAEVGASGQYSGAPGGPGGEFLSLEEWRVEAFEEEGL